MKIKKFFVIFCCLNLLVGVLGLGCFEFCNKRPKSPSKLDQDVPMAEIAVGNLDELVEEEPTPEELADTVDEGIPENLDRGLPSGMDKEALDSRTRELSATENPLQFLPVPLERHLTIHKSGSRRSSPPRPAFLPRAPTRIAPLPPAGQLPRDFSRIDVRWSQTSDSFETDSSDDVQDSDQILYPLAAFPKEIEKKKTSTLSKGGKSEFALNPMAVKELEKKGASSSSSPKSEMARFAHEDVIDKLIKLKDHTAGLLESIKTRSLSKEKEAPVHPPQSSSTVSGAQFVSSLSSKPVHVEPPNSGSIVSSPLQSSSSDVARPQGKPGAYALRRSKAIGKWPKHGFGVGSTIPSSSASYSSFGVNSQSVLPKPPISSVDKEKEKKEFRPSIGSGRGRRGSKEGDLHPRTFSQFQRSLAKMLQEKHQLLLFKKVPPTSVREIRNLKSVPLSQPLDESQDI